ncbi:hypothetical protein ABZT02_19810 [Streptomyces sp. NPDC005402]|uniref:hypothetical protein n=1 Tax=Streptomyces sp. NPDC005402 TaxID=3155338 RepID=UPI0033BF0DC7
MRSTDWWTPALLTESRGCVETFGADLVAFGAESAQSRAVVPALVVMGRSLGTRPG